VKAVNILHALDDTPRARRITTWNAASNEHMLRVNRRLGFVCEHTWENWEITLDALLGQATTVL
jgi:RimJ/RimL family protein N-acetyltransferase